MKLSVVAIGVVSALASVVDAGAFFSTCRKDWYIQKGTSIMHASCRAKGGYYRNSRLDLNYCLGNSFGRIVPSRNGNFGYSCSDCLPNSDTPRVDPEELQDLPSNIVIPGLRVYSDELQCNCGRGGSEGMALGVTFPLNDVVGNDDGFLSCEVDGAYFRGIQE